MEESSYTFKPVTCCNLVSIFLKWITIFYFDDTTSNFRELIQEKTFLILSRFLPQPVKRKRTIHSCRLPPLFMQSLQLAGSHIAAKSGQNCINAAFEMSVYMVIIRADVHAQNYPGAFAQPTRVSQTYTWRFSLNSKH